MNCENGEPLEGVTALPSRPLAVETNPFDAVWRQDRWEFRCECGASGCRAAVSMSLAEYEALRAAGSPVLAMGRKRFAD